MSQSQTVCRQVLPSTADIGERVAAETLPVIRAALLDAVPGQDLATLEQRFGELVGFLGAAVRFNTVVQGVPDWAGWVALADEDWQHRQRLLPALAAPEFSGDFSDVLEQAVAALCSYISQLVSLGFLGFLDYHEGDLAAYAFVRRQISVLHSHGGLFLDDPQGRGEAVGFLWDAPYAQQTVYVVKEWRQGWAHYATHGHVHHLQEARVAPLAEYQGTLPVWVESLKDRVPPWLARHLTVMTGRIVQEDISEQDVQSHSWQLPVVNRVRRESPAWLFGTLCVAGWSDADLAIDFPDRPIIEGTVTPSTKALFAVTPLLLAIAVGVGIAGALLVALLLFLADAAPWYFSVPLQAVTFSLCFALTFLAFHIGGSWAGVGFYDALHARRNRHHRLFTRWGSKAS